MGTGQKCTTMESSTTEFEIIQDGPLAQLSLEERAIVLRQSNTQVGDVGYFALYRYATILDYALMFLGVVAACIGLKTKQVDEPEANVYSCSPIHSPITFDQMGPVMLMNSKGKLTKTLYTSSILYCIALTCTEIKAIVVFISTFICTFSWMFTGERITKQIREQYLRAIMRQNIAYFDKLGAGEVTTRITNDTALIQEGISEKAAVCCTAIATFFSAFIIAFIKNWKLALVLSSTIPFLCVTLGTVSTYLRKFANAALDHYSSGGALAEEVFSSIRTAQAFGTQEMISAMYYGHLRLAYKEGKKKSIALGLMGAIIWFVLYSAYALAFWEGARMVIQGELTAGIVVNVFFAVVMGSMSMSQIAPNITSFTTAAGAGKKIFETIDRKTTIDSMADEG
ncbi:Leptomycin B resistance protein pmd1, partial [Neolecta irregularis DAH-3]